MGSQPVDNPPDVIRVGCDVGLLMRFDNRECDRVHNSSVCLSNTDSLLAVSRSFDLRERSVPTWRCAAHSIFRNLIQHAIGNVPVLLSRNQVRCSTAISPTPHIEAERVRFNRRSETKVTCRTCKSLWAV